MTFNIGKLLAPQRWPVVRAASGMLSV